jgi:hypothetical protein
MKSTRNILLSAFTVFAIAVLIQSTSLPGRGQSEATSANQKKESVDHIPLADYTTSTLPDGSDPQAQGLRKAKGKRYDKQRVVRDGDTGDRAVLAFRYTAPLSALPARRSAMIALGEVVDSRAYLSNDKTGVYSEFTIRLEEVFKNDSLSPLAPGNSVTAERWGGRVRFPSGRIIRYGNSGEDMPRQGRRYVFFLVGDSQQYSILTAYELRAGRIYPLDGKNAPGYKGSDWAGDAYEGTDATQFLIEVQNAIAQSLHEVREKGATQP